MCSAALDAVGVVICLPLPCLLPAGAEKNGCTGAQRKIVYVPCGIIPFAIELLYIAPRHIMETVHCQTERYREKEREKEREREREREDRNSSVLYS